MVLFDEVEKAHGDVFNVLLQARRPLHVTPPAIVGLCVSVNGVTSSLRAALHAPYLLLLASVSQSMA